MEKKCEYCGQPAHPQLGHNCVECYFNIAVEAYGADYVRREDGAIMLCNEQPDGSITLEKFIK